MGKIRNPAMATRKRHPKNRPVMTPKGPYPSLSLAAKAYRKSITAMRWRVLHEAERWAGFYYLEKAK